MTVLDPNAFYLLLASLLVLLLHLFRSRERQRDVSALYLWEGLTGDPQSRAARVRQRLDPLLLLELAVLLALVTAIAQPVLRVRSAALSGLAIVLDGSASMQTITESGSTRYERAVDEARLLLNRYAAGSTAVIQLSSQPEIIARPELDRAGVQDAISHSQPTWNGDGTVEAFLSLLSSAGGASQFERVVFLSDHPLPGLPDSFETVLITGGDNLALTAFSVRENAAGSGVTALVTALNDTASYQDVTIRIDDRENQTRLSVLMPPGSAERYVIPFPTSRGTLFTASIEPGDGFAADNRRVYSLDRPIDVRVLWLGTESRYLMAALRSVAPITLVSGSEAADLTVVHGANAPSSQTGTILLVHAGIDDFLTQGEAVPIDRIDVEDPDHPLLRGVHAADFRITEAPTASLPAAADVILAASGVPLLAAYEDPSRTVYYLAPSLLDTNLPITVDFPLLIRNVLAGLVHTSALASYRSPEVGEPVSVSGRGTIQALYDPQEEPILLPAGLSVFRPMSPGFHALVTDRGTFAIAVNVPAGESVLLGAAESDRVTDPIDRAAVRLFPLWPFAATLAALLLLAEAAARAGRRSPVRRTR